MIIHYYYYINNIITKQSYFTHMSYLSNMLHSGVQWLLFAPLTNEVHLVFPSFVAPDAELAFLLKLEHTQADLLGHI